MPNTEAKLILSGDSTKLESSLKNSTRKINAFGRKSVGTFKRIGRTINELSTRHMTGLNSVIGGAAFVYAGKSVIDFDAKLARLAIQAKLSKKEMFELKDGLLEMGEETGQMPTELLAGIDAIVERTGDFKFAVNSIKDLGIVSSATGARLEYIGATASNLNEKMGITADKTFMVFDILAAQGKAGAFTLQNMSEHFETLLSAAARFDIKGVGGMRKFGAFMQIARRGTGSSAEATTAIERTVSNIIEKASTIKKVTGFSIFDPEKSKVAGRAVMKDFDLVIKEIIKRTNGDVTKLNKIFGERSIRAMGALAQTYKKFGDFRELDMLAQAGGDGAMLMEDFAFWSDQTAAKIDVLRAGLSKFLNQNLAGPIDALNATLDFLNSHPVITQGGIWAVLGLAGVGIGAKLFAGARGIWAIVAAMGGLKAAGAAGGAADLFTGAKGMGGGKFGKLGSMAGKASLVAGVGTAAFQLGSAFEKKFIDGAIGDYVYDLLNPSEKQQQNNITMNVAIDKDGRVTTEVPGMNNNLNVSGVPRGSF